MFLFVTSLIRLTQTSPITRCPLKIQSFPFLWISFHSKNIWCLWEENFVSQKECFASQDEEYFLQLARTVAQV